MAVSATDVQKAYLAYFGRPADTVGLPYWMTQDAATMKAGFAASTEYADMYSGMTATQRVEQVYTNLLGRAAEPAGRDYWAGELAAGRETVSTLVDAMQTNALGADITTINNRVAYATDFTAALDTPAEVAGYSGNTAAVTARACVSAVHDDSTSLSTAIAAMTTSVASVVGGSTTNSTSFAGDAVIDLGDYGLLINPVQVNDRWYYYWDRSGDGTSASAGSLNGGVDYASHDVLDALFTQDIDGSQNPGTDTTDTFRYATLSGVRVALPIYGDTNDRDISGPSIYYLSDNRNYTDLAEIWDTNNSGDLTYGAPADWNGNYYWSATSSSSGHANVHLVTGVVGNNGGDTYAGSVALEVF